MRLLSLAFCLFLSCCLTGQAEPKSEWEGLTIPPEAPTAKPFIIRSTSSIADTKEPLVIINGYPAEKRDLNELNPACIESINVIKDESSVALYGSRGANGVIIIQTNGEINFRPDYTLTPEEIPANLFSLYETLNFGADKEVVYLLQGNPIKLRKLKKISTDEFTSVKVYQRELKVKLMGYSEQEVVVDVILR